MALLAAVAVDLAAQNGEGRWLQMLLVAAAAAGAYLGPRRAAWPVALLAVAGFVAVDALYGRLEPDGYWLVLLHALALGAIAFAAGHARERHAARETRFAEYASELDDLRQADSLTQLLSGGRSLSSLDVELERARRHNHQVSLIHVRLDGLHRLAESHGENGVRRALQRVAERIGEHLRVTDTALRAGAGDFWLLLPETAPEGARAVAERIRLDVGADEAPIRVGEPPLTLSVSAGIATFPGDARTNEELAQAADRALARAVERGGNRTVLHATPPHVPPGWGLGADRPDDASIAR